MPVVLASGGGVAIGVGIACFIIAIIAGAIRGATEEKKNRFRVTVTPGAEDFDGTRIEVFHVRAGGAIVAPASYHRIRYQVLIIDVTAGEPNAQPVLSAIPEMTDGESMVFNCSSPEIMLPHQSSLMTPGTEILSVPIESLIFPERGYRQLLFVLDVVSASTGRVLVEAVQTLPFNNASPGYIELNTNWDRAQELAIQLAVAVSAVDGTFEEVEIGVVKDWMRRRLATGTEEEKGEMRRRMNAAARDAVKWVKGGSRIPVEKICEELVQITSAADRYDFIELYLKVAAADGTALTSELDFIDRIATLLGVDRERFRAMTDKAVPVGIHEEENIERLLGIQPGMSAEELKKHLRHEYTKWTARVTHTDPKVREQAGHMLELIARTRSRIDETAST